MKWVYRLLGAAIAVVLLMLVAVALIPAERLAALAAARFEAATGRALTIEGPVDGVLWPRLGIRLEGVTLAAPAWAGEAPTLRAGVIDVGVAASALWGGALRLERVTVSDAVVTLVRGPDGRGSWELGEGGPSAPGDGGGGDVGAVAVDRIVVDASEIVWRDMATGTQARLEAVDAVARVGADDVLRVSGSGLLGGGVVAGTVRVDGIARLRRGGLTPLTVTAEAGATEMTLEGRADLDPPSFEGRLTAASDDRLAALAGFGLAPPDLPQGLGADRIALAAAVTLAPAGSLHLRDLTLDLDGNRLSGAVDATPGEDRPRVTATLAADALDLTGLSRRGQGGRSALVTETGWGRERIDVSWLFALDGGLTLSTGPVTLGAARIDEMRLRTALDRGRAVTTLQPVVAYGGTITGEVVVNARGGLSARANLDLAGLRLGRAAEAVTGWDRLEATADGELRLLVVGDTAQALADGAEGALSMALGRGEIAGIDLEGMVRDMDPGLVGDGRTTVFEEVRIDAEAVSGRAEGSLLIRAPGLEGTGEGVVSLGARTLDWRLMPRLRAWDEEVTIPVAVRGPWTSPRLSLDLDWLAREQARRAREALDARLQDAADDARDRAGVVSDRQAARLRDLIAEELEVAPETLDSREVLEGVIRERVQDRLLERLLDR